MDVFGICIRLVYNETLWQLFARIPKLLKRASAPLSIMNNITVPILRYFDFKVTRSSGRFNRK